MTQTSRCALLTLGLLAIPALLLGCGADEATAPAIPAQPDPTPVVQTHTLTPQTIQTTITTFGVIEALEEVDVAAELSGTVSAVHVDEGDRVAAGQVLLELDPRKRQLALEQAKRSEEQARTALQEARLRLQRRRELAEKETISKEVLDNAQLAVEAVGAAYRQASAARQLAERELADTRVISPTDGLVDVQGVEPGEAVLAGASLITLQAAGGLRMQTWVSESDVLHLSPGNIAQVSASGLPGQQFAASVEWVGVKAHPETGNFPVKLILTEGADRLRPGMTAAARLQPEPLANVMVLPGAALVDRDRRRMVFVLQDGRAELTEPLLAAGPGGTLLILAGLDAGQQVITSGQQRLLDGASVRATRAE